MKSFVEACVKAGLPNLRAHDLRRSAIRNMERATAPRKMAMEISGHKTESVYRPYDIVSQQDMNCGGQDGELLGGAEIDKEKPN